MSTSLTQSTPVPISLFFILCKLTNDDEYFAYSVYPCPYLYLFFSYYVKLTK